MRALLEKVALDLTTDHKTGRFLGTKIGEVTAGVAWTLHMLTQHPESWEHWLAYFGAVAGWSSIKHGVKLYHDRNAAPSAPNEPAAG
jgi:hypothetical protein